MKAGRSFWIALTTAVVATLLLAPLFGMKFIPFLAEGTDRDILLNLRIPRVLCAFLAGAMLSLAGASFQALFRNPLATPFTLGVSGGAALGATLFIRFGAALAVFGFAGLSLSAFAGALAATAVVYGLTRLRGGFSAATLLLAGIAMSFFFSGLILLLQYTGGLARSFRIMQWMAGSLAAADWHRAGALLPALLLGAATLLFLTRELDLLLTGDDLAQSRGVAVGRIKKRIFFVSSLMIGVTVAAFGPIGFVGMMAPHICRLMVGAGHRRLLPASLLFGGLFLAVCDTLARTLFAPAELPVGILTALLGGPFFLWLLLGRRC